ncbi:MAG: CDP-alcohol phosphatidyltransferase family protein [Bacteroidales bacterium]|jgi:cardiolipin synthase|nr:CDP-alcohol phosphatidyltransferase family protein [Bacteroidales bacterium]MDD2264704.1 CDP-alcohol phosphatidyltransferase family protein [Bacteroidales bacterium]MDD2832173.1 CDP-alcohol phosphatidyltransferase family protein [Bacteroidales bacterium]MDD3209068.1 CDP-alcohol phosphatidyltransferase family protein [Bacteroidales bacterium]MDD3697924.1 CDP-alcohol phosphatidyltransferase family protein [Bacteroidales bacterium]
MDRKQIFTIPNVLSFYRLLAFPFILWFIISGKECLYAIFLIINLVTDFLDGLIARAFKQETELGAKLDSFADNLTYILAFTGLFVFKGNDFTPHLISFLIFIAFLVGSVVMSLIRFRTTPSFHLYSTKISGYIQAAFFICLFTVGFITAFYYFMIAWGIMAAIEHMIIQLIIPQMRSNVRGLYWVLKEKKKK